MKSYFENASIDTSAHAAQVEGATYLPWAIAATLAGRPAVKTALASNGQVIHHIFGGAAVAVDMDVSDGVKSQRTWLPILNPRNQPIPFESITARSAHDALQRVRTKALAIVRGVGASIYTGFGGDAKKFVQTIGLTPESDLARANYLVSEKRDKTGRVISTYLDWAVALAAARITDPDFFWEVGMHIDPETGDMNTPYMKVNNTFMVSVNLTYKGCEHTEYLPIMGVMNVETKRGVKPMEHQPLTDPTVSDWNRAVMRCLAKGIATQTGYGLSLYSKEDLSALVESEQEEQTAPPPPASFGNNTSQAQASEKPLTVASASVPTEARAQKTANYSVQIAEIRRLLQANGKQEIGLCNWLGIKNLEEIDQEGIDTVMSVLKKAA